MNDNYLIWMKITLWLLINFIIALGYGVSKMMNKLIKNKIVLLLSYIRKDGYELIEITRRKQN